MNLTDLKMIAELNDWLFFYLIPKKEREEEENNTSKISV